jgi:anti-sigma B factor antagonist
VLESRWGTSLDPARPSLRIGEATTIAREHTGGRGVDGLRADAVKGVVTHDGAVVIQLAGELDLYNAGDVRRTLLDSATGDLRVVVDLAEVEFIDSTALGVLVEARARLPDRRRFLLAAPGAETRRALEVSGLDRHFSVHDSVDAALAAELD